MPSTPSPSASKKSKTHHHHHHLSLLDESPASSMDDNEGTTMTNMTTTSKSKHQQHHNTTNNNNNNTSTAIHDHYDALLDQASKWKSQVEATRDDLYLLQVKNAILLDELTMVGGAEDVIV